MLFGYGSNEHFVAIKLFVKKDHREMFMTIRTMRLGGELNRKYDMMSRSDGRVIYVM